MPLSRRHFLKTSAAGLASLLWAHQTAWSQAADTLGLKDLYRDDFLIGTLVNVPLLIRQPPELMSILRRDFNALVAENLFKWEYIHPTDEHWHWVYADEFMALGEELGMHRLGHPLVWHSQLPPGLFFDPKGEPLGQSALLGKLENHVTTLVDRYRGRMHAWDVVNEALDTDTDWVPNRWYQVIGADYVEKAFHFAREADPRATLIYNDYDLWQPRKRERLLSMLDDFKRRGVPVDAVGVQGHLRLHHPDLAELETTITAVAERGFRVHLSELEVDVLPQVTDPEAIAFAEYRPELDPYRDGLPPQVEAALAQRYRDLFARLIGLREHIDRVTFWGITDDQSWKNDHPIPGRTNHSLLFRRDRSAKPAYHAIKALKQAEI